MSKDLMEGVEINEKLFHSVANVLNEIIIGFGVGNKSIHCQQYWLFFSHKIKSLQRVWTQKMNNFANLTFDLFLL